MVSSWIRPKAPKGIISGIAGRGLFATEPIGADEIVAVKGGHIVTPRQLIELPDPLSNSEIQIADGLHLVALVAELCAVSSRFRELWTRAEVGYRSGLTHVRHPIVGELYLRRYRLSIPHSGGQHVIIFSADPDSPTAEALEKLRRE